VPSALRERMEAEVKGLQTLADEIDKQTGPQTGEQTQELLRRAREVKSLKQQVLDEGEARKDLDDARSFLKSLAEPDPEQLDAQAMKTARAALTPSGLAGNPQGKTWGQLFTESDQFKEFTKRYGGRDGVIPDSTKGIQSPTFFTPEMGLKSLVTGASDTSGGAFIRNDIYTPVTDLVGERELTVSDLVTHGSTESDTIEYVRITGKTNNAAPVPEATQSGLPATYNAPTGGELTSGGYKPESGVALEKVTTTIKTLAHWMPMTKRAASDAGQVRTIVDSFLRYGLNEELEDQILSGSGSGENFLGIMNSSPLTVGSAGTDIDAVVDAIKAVRVTGRRRPTAMVIHPDDWYSTGFLLAKDTQGNYILGDPRASLDQLNSIWGLRVVVSEGLAANTALVGDFRFGVLWEREGISVSVTDSHMDFFTRNLLAILAEMRAGFGVLDSQAFCTITAV